ncbi:MAG: YkgJ family cysteine cluster protein [Candidatus Melainabacteria bacterium]|nr:YkgJ family cysteine cluster protein [Candidatus Melainabacteria bacterium]
MTEVSESQLHIPDGINFDCTGCGNCCFEWPVPITRDDFARLGNYAADKELDSKKMFRVLNVDDAKLKVFSHSLEKRDDGLCAFLTDEKQCQLHNDFGAEAKPAMCRLFPYTFTQTPSGTYASVSFASTGVLYNSGRPLSDQRELLAQRFELFTRLFPTLSLDWSEAQLIDGQNISWQDYLAIEEPILERISKPTESRVEKTLFDQSQRFRKSVSGNVKLDNVAGLPTNPKIIDQVLVRNLLESYFPANAYESSSCDLDAQNFVKEFLAEPRRVMLTHGGAEYTFQDVVGVRLGQLPAESADLLRRFVYLRMFSKLYFGPGFNYLSAVAGVHHLAVLICLLRIKLKLELLRNKTVNPVDFDCLTTLAEDARVLERRLTVAFFSQETIATLEILLLSPQRVERLISLSA